MIWRFFQRILFQLNPETAHALGGYFLRFISVMPVPRKTAARYQRFPFAGFLLDSPLGVAAGFDKDGHLIRGLYKAGFGFVEVGSVTLRPQAGNPKPRVFRLEDSEALINRMGFNSQGAIAVAERLRDLRLFHSLSFPVGINIGKNRDTPLENASQDYVETLKILYPYGDYFVVNLSSPNTPGLTDLQEKSYLKPLLDSVREAREEAARRYPGRARPLLLKISPDLNPDAMKLAVETAMEAGFSGIIATNTSRRRDFPGIADRDKRHLELEGGLSGAPLRAEALPLIGRLRGWLGPKPILISVGGLGGAEDAIQRIEAGANLLQAYTPFVFKGPLYPRTIARAFRSQI